MNVLVYLIPAAFFWPINSRQFNDIDGAAMSILIDDAHTASEADEHQDSTGA